jgi:hypothetical protein
VVTKAGLTVSMMFYNIEPDLKITVSPLHVKKCSFYVNGNYYFLLMKFSKILMLHIYSKF